MEVLHRGFGMLAPGFGLLFALLANVLTYRIFGDSYYERHRWPKLSVLLMAGLACLVVGILLKRKRERVAHFGQRAVDPLSAKVEAPKAFGPPDHLMYIPLQYWSIAYFVAAIIYLVISARG